MKTEIMNMMIIFKIIKEAHIIIFMKEEDLIRYSKALEEEEENIDIKIFII